MMNFYRILLVSSLAVLAGCGVGEASVAEADDTATPVPVEVGYPVRGEIFATYDATTTIASEGDAPVLARVPGEVVEIVVEEGEWVTKGEVLARLDGDRLRLEMLSAKANLEQAEAELARNTDLVERGLISEAMFDGLQFDVDALRALYELRQLDYGYTEIRATIDGFVSNRSIKRGQMVAVNQETFRITNTNELVAYLQIPQTELAKFEVGHDAVLSVDSMPMSEFEGEIIRLSPTIDTRNGTFRATVLIDNADGNLAPGMFARFTIAWERHENAMLIPNDAIVREDEQTLVYVVADGTVERRIIETGIESNGHVEVLGGLGDDEQIVFVGHSALRDGSRVLASIDETERFAG
ncbi:MAG: efflux RND transporter periplasmic adaptor subunit [Woeseiaceae bacterium]|nr:efflux RND transporter periplasmic adaptor subunit [Woeseiaceae bacterium]